MAKRKTPNNNILEKDYNSGMTITEMGKKYSCSPAAIWYAFRRCGIKTKLRKQVGLSGAKHPQWKGGRIIKNGYPMRYMPEHSRRYKIPYVPLHVLEVEKKIGRTPTNKEPIHHIDLDRLNYHISNLYLCESNSAHQKIHSSLNKVVSILVKNKTLKFKNGLYYL